MTRIAIEASGKVNLSLEVLGKRQDGFHEVRSVIQSISLYDEVVLEPAKELSLECDLCHLAGPDNLALRAANVLREATGHALGARLELRKGIPEAAGLGGASSDAAATLVGLNYLWGLKLSPVQLEQLAAGLGSDVPFFLSGGTALVRGRGEIVDQLPDTSTNWLVLLIPQHTLAAKTATLYRLLGPSNWSPGERTEQLVEAIVQGEPIEENLLGNTFEEVADKVFPVLTTYREAMWRAGCERVHLSGAGPALFSLFSSPAAAEVAANHLSGLGYHPLVARTLTADEAKPRPEEHAF